jgi:hypothetical protein
MSPSRIDRQTFRPTSTTPASGSASLTLALHDRRLRIQGSVWQIERQRYAAPRCPAAEPTPRCYKRISIGRTSAEPQNRAQAVPKHLERKMMLATTRNDDLEDPEEVKALPGMRTHPPDLRPRHRLAQFPYGTKGAQEA